MIISKTPIRITFLGGGTDYPDYFLEHGGETLGMAIDKYSLITLTRNQDFVDYKWMVSYRKIEQVKHVDEIQHPSVRECFRYLGIEEGIQIHYTGDLPARTGLGSSSSFTVGLLNVLHTFKREAVSREFLAQEAVYVEQELIHERVGCQDQYTSSYGGLVNIDYSTDGSICLKSVPLNQATFLSFKAHLMLFYTGIKRYAHEVLKEQMENTNYGHIDSYLEQLKTLVPEAVRILVHGSRVEQFGEILHEGWLLKKRFSSCISNPEIDEMYERARRAGAIGGKLLGAGGGGFMLFFVPPEKQAMVIQELQEYQKVEFSPDFQGTRIIHSD